MHLSELKAKSPAELLAFADEVGVENASSLRKQDMMPSIIHICRFPDPTLLYIDCPTSLYQ